MIHMLDNTSSCRLNKKCQYINETRLKFSLQLQTVTTTFLIYFFF